MVGMLTLKDLQQAVAAGEIDTVVACFPDMQGRLIGKRFQAEFFLGGAYQQSHGCDYLQEDFADLGASKVKPSWAAHGFTYAALLRTTR